MSNDLVRHDNTSREQIIQADPALQLKAVRILIAEKVHQLDGVNLRLNQLKTIEIKRLELQKDVLAKEIDNLRQQMAEVARKVGAEAEEDVPVDAEFTVKDDEEAPS